MRWPVDFEDRPIGKALMVAAVIVGVGLFGLGCAAAFMIFQFGASDAFRIMGRNIPWAPYVAPFALLFTVWLFISGLASRRGPGES